MLRERLSYLCCPVMTIAIMIGLPCTFAHSQQDVSPTHTDPIHTLNAPDSGRPPTTVPHASPLVTPVDKTTASLASGTASMHLGSGDLLEVNVYNVPELTTKSRVSDRGDIYLPLIGYVRVAGLTPDEAQEIIQKKLSDGGFVKDPHVTIFIAEYTSQAVTVLGEVAKPGPYPVMGEQRLYNLLSAAGGLTEKAGRTVTIDHRSSPDSPITIHLADGLAQTSDSNVAVEPGDTIVVERAGLVYVVGDVGRPSGFLMNNDNLTVLKAIALAGGTNRTAKLNGAKIIRKTPQGMRETPIELKKILQAKAPDQPMQAEDILFVPSSAGKVAAYRGTEAILQMATALSIVAVPHP
ncbi:MAG: hypothetical protein NVS1B11_36770 [Terriglobales bacterium]